MKIAIGSDHGGFAMKEYLKTQPNIEWVDVGTYNEQSSDYPDYAKGVVDKILQQHADYGVLICKSGIGMSIAANRFSGIRAALCFNQAMAQSARAHNNANIICLAAGYIQNSDAKDMILTFLNTPFSADTRHIHRLNKI